MSEAYEPNRTIIASDYKQALPSIVALGRRRLQARQITCALALYPCFEVVAGILFQARLAGRDSQFGIA
jgi:hypothetical protein